MMLNPRVSGIKKMYVAEHKFQIKNTMGLDFQLMGQNNNYSCTKIQIQAHFLYTLEIYCCWQKKCQIHVWPGELENISALIISTKTHF
jgi:hypothetical protein